MCRGRQDHLCIVIKDQERNLVNLSQTPASARVLVFRTMVASHLATGQPLRLAYFLAQQGVLGTSARLSLHNLVFFLLPNFCTPLNLDLFVTNQGLLGGRCPVYGTFGRLDLLFGWLLGFRECGVRGFSWRLLGWWRGWCG